MGNRVIAEYRVAVALALLCWYAWVSTTSASGRRRPSLLCVRSEAVSASRASPLPCAGIARLRGSAALVVASSVMIRASGYLAYRDRCQCHPNVVSEKGCAHRG